MFFFFFLRTHVQTDTQEASSVALVEASVAQVGTVALVVSQVVLVVLAALVGQGPSTVPNLRG
jgi:hypothetical protein